jgi:hypothetical protein
VRSGRTTSKKCCSSGLVLVFFFVLEVAVSAGCVWKSLEKFGKVWENEKKLLKWENQRKFIERNRTKQSAANWERRFQNLLFEGKTCWPFQVESLTTHR